MIKELVFAFATFFVVAIAQVPTRVLTVDCAGGAHVHKGPTDFFDMGMDFGLMKRSLDAAVAVYHEHVKCKCNAITRPQLKASFTPDIDLFMRKILGGEKSSKVQSCPAGYLQLDEVPIEKTNVSVSSCSYDQWKSSGKCSFKVKINEFYLHVELSRCAQTIWPYMSFSTSGSYFNNMFRPCSTDTDCGSTLKCIAPLENNQTFDATGVIGDALEGINVWQKAETSSCSMYNSQNVASKVQEEVLKHIRSYYTSSSTASISGFKFCGFDEIISESTESVARHRQTMMRALSKLQHTPLNQWLSYPMDMVKNMIDQSLKSRLFHRRQLMQGGGVTEDNDDGDKEETSALGGEGLNDIFDIKLEEWIPTTTPVLPSFAASPKLKNRISLFKATCADSPQINLLGGISKGLKFYALKYYKPLQFFTDMVAKLVKCRGLSLSQEQLRARFLLFDPSLWATLGTLPKASVNLGAAGYSPLSYFQEMIYEGREYTCTYSYQDGYESTYSGSVSDTTVSSGSWEANPALTIPENILNVCDCLRPNQGYTTAKCVIKKKDWTKILLPSSCTADTLIKKGQCAFEYDNVKELYNGARIKLGFDLRRCRTHPTAWSVNVDCIGEDCVGMFDAFETPCSSDRDCGYNSKCQNFDICNPLLTVFNNNTDMCGGIEDIAIESGGSCKYSSDTPSSCKPTADDLSCMSNAKFQNLLVKQIVKTVNQDTKDVGAHTGMCSPGVANIDETVADTWAETAIKEETVEVNGRSEITISFKGLNAYNGVPHDCWMKENEWTAPAQTWCCANAGVRCSLKKIVKMVMKLAFKSQLSDAQKLKLVEVLKSAFHQKLQAHGISKEDIQIIITKVGRRRLLDVSYDIEVQVDQGINDGLKNNLDALATDLKTKGSDSELLQIIQGSATVAGLPQPTTAEVTVDPGTTTVTNDDYQDNLPGAAMYLSSSYFMLGLVLAISCAFW